MTMSRIAERKLRRIFEAARERWASATRWEGPNFPSLFDDGDGTGIAEQARAYFERNGWISPLYPYASTEMLILRDFAEHRITGVHRVLDLGSGGSHWIRLYRDLGATDIHGVEVSWAPADGGDGPGEDVTLHDGRIHAALNRYSGEPFDLVNAIGALFHLVSDLEVISALQRIHRHMSPGGTLVIGGNFDLWLMPIDPPVRLARFLNSRQRSPWWWTRQLRQIGFDDIRIHRNFAYPLVKDRTPENGILVCSRT